MQIFTQQMRDFEYWKTHKKFENDVIPTWVAMIIGHMMGTGQDPSNANVMMCAGFIAFEQELNACREFLDVPDEFSGGAEQVLKYADDKCGQGKCDGNKIKRMINSLAQAYRTLKDENARLKDEIAKTRANLANFETKDDVL